MQLNKEWDNMPLPNREDGDPQYEARRYLTKRNVYVKDGAPKMDIEDMPEEYLESEDIEGITMTSVLFCKHGGLICPVTSGQEMTSETNYEATFTYINRNGTITTASWNISDIDFINYEALSLDEIKKICESKNPDLVSLGYAEGIYNYCKEYKLNPKILLATLGQEQGWCKNGKYEKAFGVGPGGNPSNFNNSTSGIVAAIKVLINKYNEGMAKDSLTLKNINCDPAPNYFETKAVYKDKLADWQQKNPEYVTYMEHGQDIVCVNAAMYAKLSYTPWVDFPPQDSHPLEDWLAIYNSLEDCLRSE